MMEDKIIIDVKTLMKQYNVLIDLDKEEGTLWLYGRGRHRTYRLPKHYDETWVLMKVEEFLFFYKSSGANLSKIVGPLTEGKSCYPASYGIGFFNFFLKQSEIDGVLKSLKENKIEYTIEIKKILEKLGTPHKIVNQSIILENDEAKIFFNLLFVKKPEINDLSTARGGSLAGAGSAVSGVVFGGYTTTYSALTEEFTADAALSTVTVS